MKKSTPISFLIWLIISLHIGCSTNNQVHTSRSSNKNSNSISSLPNKKDTVNSVATFHVYADYPTWKANYYSVDMIPWDKITHLGYSFVLPGPDGKIYFFPNVLTKNGKIFYGDNEVLFGPSNTQGVTKCLPVIDKKDQISEQCTIHSSGSEQYSIINQGHKHGVKVQLIIGGWTGSKHFYRIAKDSVLTNVFINDVIRYLKEYNFDGIDLDWEYPGRDAATPNMASPEDKVNFVTFVSKLKAAINTFNKTNNKSIELSSAVPCSNWFKEAGYNAKALAQHLDYFNLMAYDFYGSWEKDYGHHSQLFGKDSNDKASLSSCIDLWVNSGVSKNKIYAGLAFYGRAWSTANKDGEKIWPGGSAGYADILKYQEHMNIQWDSTAQVPYANYEINGIKGKIGFENPQSIELKVKYAKEQGLAGVFYWEMTHDRLPNGSQPLVDAVYEAAQ